MRNRVWSFAVRSIVVGALLVGLSACGGSGSEPSCMASTTPQPADSFCAPMRIAANQPLRLQIREQCGGCTQRATQCQVTVSGSEIKLALVGEKCTLPGDAACPAICSISSFDCNVPALAPATYTVSTPAGTSTTSMMTADVTVSATACSLQ